MQSDSTFQRALDAFNAGQTGAAEGLCEALLGRDAKDVNALDLMGQIAFARGAYDQAASLLLKCASLRPKEPRAHLVLGEIRIYQGRYRDAISRYNRVLRMEKDHPRAVAGKADALEKSGDRAKARAVLAPFVSAGRDSPEMAVVQARLDLHDRNHDAIVELANAHLERGDAEGFALQHLHFLKGKALERSGRFDEAFASYRDANRSLHVHHDPDRWRTHTDELIEAFSAEQLGALPRADGDTSLPVFIVGMPRSGSTLIETIIDAHPQAHAGGELPFVQENVNAMSLRIGSTLPYPACVADLDRREVVDLSREYLDRLSSLNRRAARITDKYLMSFRHLGLIEVLFPGAHVIHCRRDPLDTCVSCFMEPLPRTAHPYASDLVTLGAAYRQYERLMDHWRQVLRIPMLEVRYEDLVSDQEGVSRRIIEFCGLPWDDQCLRYHETGRDVRTLSADQVNKPIYTSSVGRHERFDRHLGPLREALGG